MWFGWNIFQIIAETFIHFIKLCWVTNRFLHSICCIRNGVQHQRCSLKKLFLQISQNSQENTYQSCRPETYNFIKKDTLPQVFSCEFCEICMNNFFKWHLWATASITSKFFRKVFSWTYEHWMWLVSLIRFSNNVAWLAVYIHSNIGKLDKAIWT